MSRMTFFLYGLFSIVVGLCEGLQVSSLSHVESYIPGEFQQVKLTLFNDKEDVEIVELKLSHYACNSEGFHFFEELDSHPRSNLSWVRLGGNRIQIPPREQISFFYTIQIPDDHSLQGSYWSVLLIEPSGIVKAPDSAPEQEGLLLNVKVRFAHHIVTTIGKGETKLKVTKKAVKEINGKKFLCIDVMNNGDFFIEPTLTLKLYNCAGKLDKTLETAQERLYPGSSQCYFLDISEFDFEEGKYKGFILLDGGNNHLFGSVFSYP